MVTGLRPASTGQSPATTSSPPPRQLGDQPELDYTKIRSKTMTPNSPTQELSPVRYDVSLLTSEDFHLFNEGSHYRVYEKMGAHVVDSRGTRGRVFSEIPPRTASIVWDLDYPWNDAVFLEKRAAVNSLHAPMSIYEVHLGSWMRVAEEGNRSLSYREIAPRLA